MFAYWALFSYFMVGSLSERSSNRGHRISSFFLLVGAIVVALLIGLRFQVGGDWSQYEQLFAYARFSNTRQMLEFGDPAYQLLNLVVADNGGDLWLVNLISGAIFTWGLYRLAKTQPDPWLVMLAAIPYLVVVVAMGYTRQAVAIGILMAGLASLFRGGSVFKYALYVAAVLRDTRPVSLRLSRRDASFIDSDAFAVSIDSYHDHQSSYFFWVNPSGSRRDGTGDPTWDPVWEVQTTIDSLGWSDMVRVSRDEVPHLPDRVIAATALALRLPLITRDGKIRAASRSPLLRFRCRTYLHPIAG